MSSVTVSRYWFSDPTVPLAVASAVWFSQCWTLPVAFKQTTKNPLFEFTSRSSFTQQILAGSPQRASTSHGLCFPTARARSKVHITRAVPGPLCSAFRVWLPSGRFTPFDLSPALFRAGSAHGIHPSKLSPLEKYPNVSARMHPPTVSPPCYPVQAPSRHDRRSFWASTFFESPVAAHMCLAHKPLAAPLGFVPSRVFSENLDPDFARSPLTRFSSPSVKSGCRATEYRSAFAVTSPVPCESQGADEVTLIGFLHRLIPHIQARSIRAMYLPRAGATALLRTPALFGWETRPTGVDGIGF